jgi:hypothetical protein
MKSPRVVELVLCRSTEIDMASGGLALRGVFHSMTCETFPTPPQPFVVYSGLHGGGAEGTIEVEVSRLETEERVNRYQRWYAFPGPSHLLHLEITLRRCCFPAPGRYGLHLRFDGQELASRVFDVLLRRGDR